MITANKIDDSALEIQKRINAPIDKVYKAWTEPEQMSQWFGCDKATSIQISQNLYVGGEYCIEVTRADGKEITMSGTYIEVVPGRKLVYSWNNTSVEHPAENTVISVEFIDHTNSTEIVLKHSKFTIPLSVQGHAIGWGGLLEKLETFLK